MRFSESVKSESPANGVVLPHRPAGNDACQPALMAARQRPTCPVHRAVKRIRRPLRSNPQGWGLDRERRSLRDVMSLHLVIGNKNYSSWSFRPWLAMKVAGIRFDETVGSLDAADFKTRVTALGGAGRVPVLSDGDVRVWESLAILEYLAEKFPAARL